MARLKPHEQYESDRRLVVASLVREYETAFVSSVARNTGLPEERVVLVLRVMERQGFFRQPSWGGRDSAVFSWRDFDEEVEASPIPAGRYDPLFCSKKRLTRLERKKVPEPVVETKRLPFGIGTRHAVPIRRRRASSVLARALNHQALR